jgi:hypothetical protein
MKVAPLALFGVSLAFVPLLASVTQGCSTARDPSAPADASPDAAEAGGRDAADDAPTDGAPDVPAIGPSWSPEGWVHFGPSGCGYIIPTTRDALPPPIRWENCPDNALPGVRGAQCRMISPSWPAPGDPWVAYPGGAIAQRGGNAPSISFVRSAKHSQLLVVADVDGPVHTAQIETRRACWANHISARDGRFAFSASVKEDDTSFAIAGRIGDLRPAIYGVAKTPGTIARFFAGTRGLGRLSFGFRISLFDWDTETSELLWKPQDDNALDGGDVLVHGADVLFTSHSRSIMKIKVHRAGEGSRDLVSFGDDLSRGAGHPGTDGRDFVWVEGSGGTEESRGLFPRASILTAPYSNDAATLTRTKRLLRSDAINAVMLGNSVVGCGYGSVALDDRDSGEYMRFVVRLSDGAAWKLPARAEGFTWGWREILGITCDEVFAVVNVSDPQDSYSRIVRVPLTALGTPIPPNDDR